MDVVASVVDDAAPDPDTIFVPAPAPVFPPVLGPVNTLTQKNRARVKIGRGVIYDEERPRKVACRHGNTQGTGED